MLERGHPRFIITATQPTANRQWRISKRNGVREIEKTASAAAFPSHKEII
jgi:hypothetical protein